MNPYLLLGAVIVWGLSLVVVGKWQRHDGATGEQLICTTEKNAQLVTANATIAGYRKKEQDSAKAIAVIGEKKDAELEALEAKRVRDVAAARSGALKLRLPASVCPPRGGVPDPAAAATRSDATETVELPREVGADLYALANDADEVAILLGGCQATIHLYRGTKPS